MSSEIRVVAVVQGKAGTADAIQQVLLRCVAPSRAETGCLLYTPHRDLDCADRFVFFERWTSRAALDLHKDWSANRLGAFVFISADRALNTAATAEGLTVEGPNSHP